MKPNSESMKSDAKYEKFLEENLKINHPYEYALLKSDLKENMLKRPVPQEPRDTKEEFHIVDNNIRRQIRWSGKTIYQPTSQVFTNS